MTAPKYVGRVDGGQYLGEQIQLIYHRMRSKNTTSPR